MWDLFVGLFSTSAAMMAVVLVVVAIIIWRHRKID
jgi:hypothetical protein